MRKISSFILIIAFLMSALSCSRYNSVEVELLTDPVATEIQISPPETVGITSAQEDNSQSYATDYETTQEHTAAEYIDGEETSAISEISSITTAEESNDGGISEPDKATETIPPVEQPEETESAFSTEPEKIIEKEYFTSPVTDAVKQEESYICNTNTKKFHRLDCRYAAKIKQENVRYASSREEAVAAGCEPCKVCKP